MAAIVIGMNLALAYYKSGEIALAARELTTVRAVAPDNAQVTLLLADSWLRMGENAKVIQLLTPLAEKNAGDLAVAYLLGSALVRDKRVDEGQRVLNRIFEKGDSAESRLLLGTSKLNISDFAGALVDLEKSVEMNPQLPSANSYLGTARMATGDATGALESFRKELALNPSDYDSNLNIGVILRQDKEFAEAMKHLTMALRVRPGDIRVRYQVATIDLSEGRVDQARRSLEQLIQEVPSYTEAHVSLATAYYRLKRKEDGDRERAIVEKLNAEAQTRQPKGDVIR